MIQMTIPEKYRERPADEDNKIVKKACNILNQLEGLEVPVFPLNSKDEKRYASWFALEDDFLTTLVEIEDRDERKKLLDWYHEIGNMGERRVPSVGLVKRCLDLYFKEVYDFDNPD